MEGEKNRAAEEATDSDSESESDSDSGGEKLSRESVNAFISIQMPVITN